MINEDVMNLTASDTRNGRAVATIYLDEYIELLGLVDSLKSRIEVLEAKV